ncbi:META domain-containing protein [Arthrobacter sp. LAPM80]|uniref:META domain-containing protein n=1 Tax=Arthrobacter sp. LAPM80 TaxID=3141788 RepID=UPI00398B5C9F
MKRIAAIAGGLLLALTLSSCGATTGPAGTWGDGYNTDKKPYLQMALAADNDPGFQEAGFVTGSDGCNRLSGQWYLIKGELTFQQLSGTKMHCEGVDTWVSKAASGVIDGDVMTVKDATGATIGTLERRN